MKETNNIKYLVELLKDRLGDSSNTAIYSNKCLENFLNLSLSEFNQTPIFTNYSFNNDIIVNMFSEVLIEGATLYALASQALLERGREFVITDNNISLTPPNISDMLNTQYCELLKYHFEKLKLIKSNILYFKNVFENKIQ